MQGTILTGSVPTVAERNSGYTNLSDLITGQTGTSTDALGRTIPVGTILDPATTRPVLSGVTDPRVTVLECAARHRCMRAIPSAPAPPAP